MQWEQSLAPVLINLGIRGRRMVKGTIIPAHVIKAYGGNRGTAPFIRNIGTR
jgi:hypothetical protein